MIEIESSSWSGVATTSWRRIEFVFRWISLALEPADVRYVISVWTSLRHCSLWSLALGLAIYVPIVLSDHMFQPWIRIIISRCIKMFIFSLRSPVIWIPRIHEVEHINTSNESILRSYLLWKVFFLYFRFNNLLITLSRFHLM